MLSWESQDLYESFFSVTHHCMGFGEEEFVQVCWCRIMAQNYKTDGTVSTVLSVVVASLRWLYMAMVHRDKMYALDFTTSLLRHLFIEPNKSLFIWKPVNTTKDYFLESPTVVFCITYCHWYDQLIGECFNLQHFPQDDSAMDATILFIWSNF